MLLLAILLPFVAWWRLGGYTALGVSLGCAVAYLNFLWLERGVEGLANRIVGAGQTQSGKGIVARFVLRYALMGAVAYGILSVSPASLYGFLVGLFLPVAAIACEAAYEAYVALARGL
jgi:predicted outer membrane lipoprotein